MRHNEAKSQRAVIEWWAWACRQFKVPEHLLFSVPNGGYRRAFEAKLLVAEGSRAGVPDLLLLVPRRRWHGLAVEMKTETGKIQPSQLQFLADLSDQGYAVEVCRSTEQAIEKISEYLKY